MEIYKKLFTPNTTIKCDRCKRRVKFKNAQGWNMTMVRGMIAGHLCPNCQTPEENAEAEINLATTSYGRDAFGRIIGNPKVVA